MNGGVKRAEHRLLACAPNGLSARFFNDGRQGSSGQNVRWAHRLKAYVPRHSSRAKILLRPRDSFLYCPLSASGAWGSAWVETRRPVRFFCRPDTMIGRLLV